MAEFIKDPKLCAKCGVDGCFLKCPCKQVMYCGKKCQKDDWNLHKTNCRAILDKKVRQAKKEHGREDNSVAQARTDAGDAHFVEGRYAQAEKSYLEAHRIDLQNYGAEHPIVVGHTRQLGQLYAAMGQHQKAKMMLEESLAISRRTLGEKSRAVAEALHYMSTLMLQMGDFQEGLKKMEEARLIFQDIPGNHRERLTHIASTMAFYRQRAGMMQLFSEKGGLQGYQESESTQNNIKMQLEALQACRAARKNDTDGQEVVELLLNVGTAYGDAGKEVEARAYYEEALEIIRRLHGDKHPLVAVVLTNIANSLARRSLGFSDSDGQNHLDEAYTIFEKVLKIRIRVDGEESEVVADTLLNMGTFLMEQGKTGDAVEKMEQAIRIFTRVLGKNHQKIAGAHFFLVKLRMLERDLEGALIHCEESVRMYKELGVGPNDVRLQETQKMLGMLQFSPPVRSNQSPPTSSKDHLHGLD